MTHCTINKRIVRAVTEDHAEAARAGLRYIQANANRVALEELCRTRDREYNETRERYEAGESLYHGLVACVILIGVPFTASQVFVEAKENTKKKLHVSKAKLESIDDELRETFKEMEAVSETEFISNGLFLSFSPQSGDARSRSTDELREALENERAKLEVCFATNPGVIEQFERREAEVHILSSVMTCFVNALERRLRTSVVLSRARIIRDKTWSGGLKTQR